MLEMIFPTSLSHLPFLGPILLAATASTILRAMAASLCSAASLRTAADWGSSRQCL